MILGGDFSCHNQTHSSEGVCSSGIYGVEIANGLQAARMQQW
jgi:hypothetical protein